MGTGAINTPHKQKNNKGVDEGYPSAGACQLKGAHASQRLMCEAVCVVRPFKVCSA